MSYSFHFCLTVNFMLYRVINIYINKPVGDMVRSLKTKGDTVHYNASVKPLPQPKPQLCTRIPIAYPVTCSCQSINWSETYITTLFLPISVTVEAIWGSGADLNCYRKILKLFHFLNKLRVQLLL